MKLQHFLILTSFLALTGCINEGFSVRFKSDEPIPMSAYVSNAIPSDDAMASLHLKANTRRLAELLNDSSTTTGTKALSYHSVSNGLCDGRKVAFFVDKIGHAILAIDGSDSIANCPGTFNDPYLSEDYVPVSMQEAGDYIYVAYARNMEGAVNPSSGNGTISVFSKSGKFVKRLVSEIEQLNQPTSMTIAPDNFGAVSNMLLVANAGDGRILAFDIETGRYAGAIFQEDVSPIIIKGLRTIYFGDQHPATPDRSLFYAAGSEDKGEYTFGRINLRQH